MKKDIEIIKMNGPLAIKTLWERVVVEGFRGEAGSGRSWRFIVIVAERSATKREKNNKY